MPIPKRLSAFLIAIAAVTLTGACSAANKTNSADPAEAAKTSSASKPAELSIASYSGWTAEAFEETFGKSIRAKFPQHTFKFIEKGKDPQYYETLISTGQPIDIIWDSLAYFVTYEMGANMQFDMSELIKKQQVNINALEPSMVEAIRSISDGKLFALPVVYNTQLLYYNKDLFDKFGIPYAKDGMNWDQAIELSHKLTRLDGGVQYVGLGVATTQHVRQNSFSLPYLDKSNGKATINNGQWDVVYDVFQRLAEAPGYRDFIRAKNNLPSAESFYKDRNLAMLADLANTHLIREGFGDFNWDAVSVPTYAKLPGIAPQASPTIFGIANVSKNKEAAMEVINHLVSEPFQIEVAKKGTLPVMKTTPVISAYGQETKFKDKNVKVIFTYKNAPIVAPTIYNDAAQKAYLADIKSLMLGEIDRNTLLRKAEEAANKSIEQLRK
ncbi:MAG: extracellular solute-binding protein family 1 [Paenibacillus sp.]|nr:extracellular solute-binding protein family 1 [Paenibacillus sp.]